MKYKYILFDLDGTLTDPKVGITKSAAYALKKMKNIDENPDDLTKFIGPPLMNSFKEYYGLSESEAIKAIDYFREYFSDKGIFENIPYDGIVELLELLSHKGIVLAVATSKPTFFATQVLEYFKMDHFFDCIIGSNLDNTRTDKAEIISEVFNQLSITDRDGVVMIGDRKHDVIGANKRGIASIGVEYGYGSFAELQEVNATFIAKEVSDLKRLLLG